MENYAVYETNAGTNIIKSLGHCHLQEKCSALMDNHFSSTEIHTFSILVWIFFFYVLIESNLNKIYFLHKKQTQHILN